MAVRVGGPLIVAFVASLVLLVIIGVASYRSVSTLIENNEQVIHTQEVLERLQDIQLSLIQVETDARGFLLTGDDVYREAYERDLREIPIKIAATKEKTVDNASHQRKFLVLEQAVNSRLELLQEYVARKQVLGATVIPTGQGAEGKRRMDAVKNALTEIAEDERTLLASRLEQSRASTSQLLITMGLSFLAALTLICVVFYLALRDIKAREVKEAILKESRDMLERRVAERTVELADANLELERSNRELQDFAFVASHDLQEPLRKIQAFGDRLRTTQASNFDDQGRDYLDRMHGAAGRMHTLINDLLTFSRVTTKAQPFERIDLNKIASDVLNDLETTIEQAGGRVEISELPAIDADPLQMRQLFQNLIANALKFQKPDSEPVVRIDARTVKKNTSDTDSSASNEFVEISFADNGIGFDEKYLDRIFTPFQRLHGRNEYEGTGIGLAVCRKIVERHGGSLTARSAAGEGATFIATLPVIQENKEKK